ncbi:MAG TPA: 3-phosphoshikimate 1-carboxyvinyltransferase [Flavobacteriaceae bacterium]|nr:3-phosphoshikimate 1-carboxyvinyltransferase [Flavobacteriaceae bacterium]
MNLTLSVSKPNPAATLKIFGSKSESNRLLILQALFPHIEINNLSDSDDTKLLQKALVSNKKTIDVGHAGTAMRFLTAYFSIQEGKEILLTGSERMQNRPIGILVEALQKLGADISYEKEPGFPPLRIRGRKLNNSQVQLSSNISSQYISALMLIAPKLPGGLEIELQEQAVSFSYLEMTKSLLKKTGISCEINGNKIHVFSVSTLSPATIFVEPDWSSASYFYSIVALSDSAEIRLQNFRNPKISYQGDSVVAKIYGKLGVETTFSGTGIILKKIGGKLPGLLQLDLSNTPDLAQTIAVSCLGLKIPCKLLGLQTLKIKETNRLLALKTELEKCNAKVKISENSLEMLPPESLPDSVEIDTYDDHRMAMAFAPLALKISIGINDAEVVSKSYPQFWQDLEKQGFSIKNPVK